MKRRNKLATTLGTALLVAAALPLGSQVDAADHRDGTAATDDFQADINDIYAWHDTKANTLTVLVTFHGFIEPGAEIEYDPNVLYTIHIDNTAEAAELSDWDSNDNDNESDIQIYARFGQNMLGEWGLQLENVPGTTGPLVGPVGEDLTEGAVRATSGVFDDPFFFDLEGFQATAANLGETDSDADLGFYSLQPKTFGMIRDTFAGFNAKALIIEMDLTAALAENADGVLQVWTTTGRAP